MIARLIKVRGEFRFVYFVPSNCEHGIEGAAIEEHRRAWRRSVFRPPGAERDRYTLTLMQQAALGRIKKETA